MVRLGESHLTLDVVQIREKSRNLALVLEALREAHTIRPQRYTILDRDSPETIERAARETGVIS